ncbi:MAG TPA: hypothetical protein VF550_08565 [Polyangia bacterium]
MTPILCIPLFIQAALMFIDEMHFHRLRGLPRWERVGHPIDTLSVLICYGVTLTQPPSNGALTVYAALATLSCVLVTKDEFVHSRRCLPAEQWIHSLLFVLHPIVLGAAALLWFKHKTAILVVQSALTVAFGCYQLLYWNFPWTRHPRAQ